MKETIVRFGERSGNVGILSHARVTKPSRPCVILMNSGLVHRVGPNRIYVKLARQLASKGFDVLRMDFSGVGDSLMRRDHLPYEKSSAIEVAQAMEAVEAELGKRDFVLAGICSGAEAALQIANADTRVRAIVPIEFYGYDTSWYRIYSYRSKLFNPKSWLRLLSGRSELLSGGERSRNVSANSETSSAAPPTSGASPAMPVQQRRDLVVSMFRDLAERGVHCCLVYAAGAAHFNFRTIFRWPLRELVRRGELSVVYLDSCDHTFTLLRSQAHLVEEVSQWLETKFPLSTAYPDSIREEEIA